MGFGFAVVTDQGKRRANQDSLLCMQAKTSKGTVFFAAVCDGMGGLSKGELASANMVRLMERWFSNEFSTIIGNGPFEERLFASWRAIVSNANEKLIDYGNRYNVEVGTTLSGILLFNYRYYILHVGDSRIYEISDDSITCLTKDHTLAMSKVEQGELRYEDMEKDRRRSVLTNCVGATGGCIPDLFSGKLHDETVFVLCSDGFRHTLSANEIQEQLCPEKQVSQEVMSQNLHGMIEEILLRGEKDNISAIVIKYISE